MLPTSRFSVKRIVRPLSVGALLALSVALPTRSVQAFCGFYVAGGDTQMFNDATQVVLMREGTRTVLSMQNNYRGPVADFAMVVPVPVVLKEQNVKTLPAEVFKKIDQLSAPRLVEYWEQDPCQALVQEDSASGGNRKSSPTAAGATPPTTPSAVKIEAQFAVGEYEIVILSATEATALEKWLVDNNYKIPQGSGPVFNGYIQQGMFFFVAKVNPAKAKFEKGQAVLSPLRFDYESKDFALPVRLGMINSAGSQDLIIQVLSREGRFEVANAANVTVPTNIEVTTDVRKDFGTFYTKLFDETIKKTPKSVVTEYSWDASTCDPCPGPTLDSQDFATLGADVLDGQSGAAAPGKGGFRGGGFTLTRLHARYGKDGLGDDFVFRRADAIFGGRENWSDKKKIETGATKEPNGFNNFQGRYIMRNRWTGPVTCKEPVFGVWGGPPDSRLASEGTKAAPGPNNGGVAAAPSSSPLFSRTLDTLVAEPVPELNVTPKTTSSSGSSVFGCTIGNGGHTKAAGAGALALLGLGLIARRRRRRS